jgi:hypothetical protein
MARLNVDMARISNRIAPEAAATLVMLVGLTAAALLVLPRPDTDGALRFTDEAPASGASSSERHETDFQRDRLYGSLGLDTITPIYSPEFSPADEARVHDGTFVIGLAIDDEARAYPVSILNRHEMVNDVVGGVPVLVTW